MTQFLPPTAEQVVRVHKDVGANKTSIEEAKVFLINWLRMQPHLPDSIDEDRLEHLYINCKCSLERTKAGLDAYFSLRSRLPELLQNRDPFRQDLRSMMADVLILPMPQLTPEGYRVNLSFAIDPSIERFEPDLYIKSLLMMLEVRLAEDCVNGDIYVIECSKLNMSHIAAFGAARIRKAELCVRTAYCSRIKAIHFVNISHIMDLLYKIVLSAMSPKIVKRVHMHTKTTQTLLEHMPAECLPNELGGKAGPIANFAEAWQSKLASYRGWFTEQDDITSDEASRPGKDPYGDGLFGCEGSFRKLQLD